MSVSYLEDPKEYLRLRRKKLASRGEAFYSNLDEENTFKLCNHCKRLLPLSRFNRDLKQLDGFRNWCRDCQKEYQFLYKKANPRAGNAGGYFTGTQICLICGEVHPLLLETHHLFGRNESDFRISLCANCHALLIYFPLMIWNKSKLIDMEENVK